MIEPPPARRKAGMPYLQPKKTPLTLISKVKSQTSNSVLMASSSRAWLMPALLKRMLSFPNVCSA
jgi:hypothetical protein